eukprot:gene16357-18665_t
MWEEVSSRRFRPCSPYNGYNTAAFNFAQAKGKVKKEADESEEEEEDDTTERTMECVVCGKLFPRGPIDLARHQTAVTLKHLVHPRHTATYHFGCKRCGSHFTTAEHLAMHTEQSTCNPEMVWPTTVAPGAKCITRAEAAELDAAEAAGIHTAAEQAKVKATKDIVKKVATPAKAAPALVDPTTGKLPKRAAAVAAVQVTPAPPSQSKNKQNQQSQQTQQVPQQSSHSNQQPISGRRGRDSISGEGSTELYFPKTKRAKVIVPEDRKAFFAIVSLLIDPEEVPESEKLTEDNYEAFLPPQHKKLVDALKA